MRWKTIYRKGPVDAMWAKGTNGRRYCIELDDREARLAVHEGFGRNHRTKQLETAPPSWSGFERLRKFAETFEAECVRLEDDEAPPELAKLLSW